MPDLTRLASRLVAGAWVLMVLFLLDRLCLVLMDLWLLESLGFASVFWTNFSLGAVLFLVGLLSGAGVVLPAFQVGLAQPHRRLVVHVGVLFGLVSAYFLSREFLVFLMAAGEEFGSVDPVFGKDIGFYVFTLPGLKTGWWFCFLASGFGLLSWIVCSSAALPAAPQARLPALGRLLGAVGHVGTRVALSIFGVVCAAGWWLGRYDVLVRDNESSSVMSGAAYVDVTGLFSTVNEYHVTALATLAATAALVLILARYAVALRSEGTPKIRPLALVLLAALAGDLAFKGAVGLRQLIAVRPNEPVIQLPYITRHIAATRVAYDLGEVETVRLVPKDRGDPLPDVDALLANPTLRNVSLWPGFCSYLEDLVDIQHRERVLLTGGDTLVYGPLLEIVNQQQKLRAYYDFLDIDTVRYEVDGQPTMLASAVREVSLLEPQPWLAWWGQQYMLFTHGYGIVTTHVSQKTPEGDPVYVSKGIPVRSDVPELRIENQRAYYAEGAGSMAYSNVRDMSELDYPTDEGRQVTTFPSDVEAGVRIDSLLKRVVLGYKSGQFWQLVFSELIDDATRVHYFRTPIERLERVAPFLFYDSDPYAVTADGGVHWIVNGMTHTDRYPYSAFHELGDKSDTRSPFGFRPHETVNYVRDAVKCTVDAYTGALRLYKFADEPVVNVLASIYPDLFTPIAEMPGDVRKHLQYPVQLMHVQFDDAYILYQMNDTMTFFNMEDMWDDGDEVLGPMLDSGKAVRFSIEPFYVMVDTTNGLIPDSDRDTQFALCMVFTPQSALNLRAIPMVYQDGEDYGRMVCFQVPKGHYFLGPEQADALIDEEPAIAQQLSWWNRQGLEVIRGHTTTLLVDGEVIYVEPIFLRSEQNRVTQLKQVCVVFRGKAVMAPTLEQALREAVDSHR